MYNIHFFVPENYAEVPKKEILNAIKTSLMVFLQSDPSQLDHCDLMNSKNWDKSTFLLTEG